MLRLLAVKSPKPIELHVLGGPKGKAGKAVLNRLMQLNSKTTQVFTAQGYVSDAHIAKIMAVATCMIAPIQQKTRFKVYRETYGCSKVSGFENDIRRYAVPCFYPKAYRIDDALHDLSFGYETEQDLVTQLINLPQHNPANQPLNSAGDEVKRLVSLI